MFDNEKVVETKTCKHCEVKFEITDKDLEFYEKVSPVFAGKKYNIPSPTLCPDCRQQRRLSFRNERKLYKRKCDATGRSIISIYSPDKPYKVYDQEIWWSDKWDPMYYGKDFDFNRSFFEQFDELMKEMPHSSRIAGLSNENSDYINYGTRLKNCYLVFTCEDSDNCFYGNYLIKSSYCLDSYNCYNSQYIYNSIDIVNSFNIFNSYNCEDCFEGYNIVNCRGCKHCINCSNLVNKEYFFDNVFIGELAYKEKVKEINYLFFNKNIFYPSLSIKNSENCTGDNIKNSSKCFSSFEIENSNNCKFCYQVFESEDCQDTVIWGGKSKFLYDSQCVGNNSYILCFCSNGVTKSNYIYYGYACQSCNNLFGCIGLKNKSYCILNKQYTKEEYEELVPKIIEHMQKTGEWGEFFPSSISPFGYNETVANEYFPLDRRDVLSKHIYKWSDYEAPFPKVEKIIPADKLPENIADVPDDILNWAIECEITKKPFRIIKQELEFYRKHNLPLPKRHPDQRHLDRMKLRNPRKLFDRKCDKCGKDMKTTYAPERPEIVYCEECYIGEVY